MQKLYFEAAWDKTISPKDRETIVNHFEDQVTNLTNGVHFSFLWKAKNYKDERLVTVLIHNNEEISLFLKDTVIAYYEQSEKVATGIFNLPIEIPGMSSMPWTFIFSHTNETDKFPQYDIVNEVAE